MEVEWPDRRQDVLEALDLLLTVLGMPEDGAAPRPTLSDAVHWLVDDTFWDMRDPAEDIGSLLVNEHEAAAIRGVVAAVVTVSDRQGPTAPDQAWLDDPEWPVVRKLARRAATAMRGRTSRPELSHRADHPAGSAG